MALWIAFILGAVQGLTEFLPVSSSGHLVLLEQIFGIKNDILLFDIVLHIGTFFAVIIIYRKTLLRMLKNPFDKKVYMLILATIPTVIIALLFEDFFVSSFNGSSLIFGFLVTAIFMLICEYVSKKQYQYKKMDYPTSFLMGIFQGLAILPGISRSGSTITSAIVCGVKRSEAAEFSFLLSLPIILGSAILEFIKLDATALTINFSSIFIGFISSLIFGLISIKFMLNVIKNAKYHYFAIYLFLLTGFLILNKYVLFLF